MIEYDSFGRMKYNPDLHGKQGTTWLQEDIDYLIQWGNKIGIEEISLALERDEGSVCRKMSELRKKGKLGITKTRNFRLLKKANG